jgi:hypothetical protein
LASEYETIEFEKSAIRVIYHSPISKMKSAGRLKDDGISATKVNMRVCARGGNENGGEVPVAILIDHEKPGSRIADGRNTTKMGLECYSTN